MASTRKYLHIEKDNYDYKIIHRHNITKINVISANKKSKWQAIIDEKSNLDARKIYKIFNKFNKGAKSDTEISFPKEWSPTTTINLKTIIDLNIYCWQITLFLVRADTKYLIEEINMLKNHIYELHMNIWNFQQNMVNYQKALPQYVHQHDSNPTTQDDEDLVNDINNLLENHYQVSKSVEPIY